MSYKEKIAFYNNPDYCFLVKEKDKEIMERALYGLAEQGAIYYSKYEYFDLLPSFSWTGLKVDEKW